MTTRDRGSKPAPKGSIKATPKGNSYQNNTNLPHIPDQQDLSMGIGAPTTQKEINANMGK